jgi:hypothetical protein
LVALFFFYESLPCAESRESAMGIVYPCWLAILIFLVAGLLSGVRGISEERIRRRLHREGIETEAVVIGHWVERSAYYVTYRYQHQGQCYKREEQVGFSKYQVWPRGSKILIRYLPQDPSVIRIVGEKNHYLSKSFLWLASVIFVVAIVIVLGLPWLP